MTYQLDIRRYRRPFKTVLYTHHGPWHERTGMIVRLIDPKGQAGFGEIAPLPDFGTETLEQAEALCESLAGSISADDIQSIPDGYPACQFGLESAWESMTVAAGSEEAQAQPTLSECRLLPTGAAALDAWSSAYQRGDRTFKWKIGVAPLGEELAIAERLLRALPAEVCLRLDANGGLDWDQAQQWLQQCDRLTEIPNTAQIEFLEQPLPPSHLEQMLDLSCRYTTSLALDESVATLPQLQDCYAKGWRGIVVIKAAIAGFPSRLRDFCCSHSLDVVWSSVFETAIARQYILKSLVMALPSSPRALGFGVGQWFQEDTLDQPTFDAGLLFSEGRDDRASIHIVVNRSKG